MSDTSKQQQQSVAPNMPVAVGAQDPAQSDDTFIAEFANMDLEPLRDKTYLVSINTGDRNKGKFLTSQIHGPYDFLEMVEEVGYMWEQHQHHAKVIVCDKNRNNRVQYLDQKTTDYIEAHYPNIIAEGILEDAIAGVNEPFTHTATIISSQEETPIIPKKEEVVPNAAPQIAAPIDPDDEDL